MMKKISKILLAFILLFLVGISSASAAASYRFSAWPGGTDQSYNTTKKLKDANLIEYDWYEGTEHAKLCANGYTAACKKQGKPFWNVYWVSYVKNGKSTSIYITYCVNPSLTIHYTSSGDKNLMSGYTDLNSIKFSTTVDDDTKAARLENLRQLLLYGYNPDPNNKTSAKTLVANDQKNYLKLIAMQVLVWEVMEGGRTTFDTVAPDAWNGDATYKSLYNEVIYPNGGSEPEKEGTIYYYYQQFRMAARDGEKATPAPAFNEEVYTLAWDSVNQNYKVTISGLGDYNSCSSSNPKVNVSEVTNSTVTLTSTETITDAKITCKYMRGNGPATQTKEEEFRFFRFSKDPTDAQDMLHGSGWKVYSNDFNVTTENTNLKIKKIDTDSQAVSGAKFTLTHMTNQSYSVVVDGNGDPKNLNLSGKYRVSETTAPAGYEKITDFNITINAKTHKITSCENSSVDTNGDIISCLNNQVRIKYNTDTIEMTIVDVAKNFKIQKVNKNGTVVNGATFEIRDSNNELVKFSMANGNMFKYDPAGTITSLNIPTLSSYPISLLPEGEYKIIETVAPAGYRLPKDENLRTTLIKINSNSDLLVYDRTKNTYTAASAGTVRIVNYYTRINVSKTGHGSPLQGVQFELYNSDKSEKIKCYYYSPGYYIYVDDQTTVDNYVYVTDSYGYITIDNLPEGTYYFKEIATIEPFVLPTGDGVYTKVEIDIDENGVSINGNYTLDTIEISNTPNSFNFYKKDTEGNALTTGKYKLQKYDKTTKKYIDLKLVEVPNDGTYSENTDIYKVDNENGKIQFTLTKGVATFIDMESSTTYRIIETVAPEGYTKVATKDTATVHIDEYGNASGLLILVDQKVVKEDDSAYAELIVNIQTGKQRIMYAAVIFLVIGAIVGLIIYNKRK